MTLLSKASIIATPTAYGDGVLNSVKPTDGAGDFDFARASSATRVNEQGLIEKERENLLLQSNQFDTSWSPNSGTFTQGVSDPNGGTDAWIWEAVNTSPYLYQTLTPYSGISCLSIWVKGVGSTIGKNFQIRGGTAVPLKTITLTSDWQRVQHYGDYSSNPFIGFEFGIPAVIGDVVHIYAAQYEQGLVATDYIETTTSSVAVGITNDIPRINFENGIGNFLLEPQRTNLVPYSEYFNASSWLKTNTSIIDNSTTSPEGIDNSSKLIEDSTNNTHYIAENITTLSGVVYSISIFAKKNERRYMRISRAGGSVAIGFDLENGNFVTGGGADGNTEDLGNGWYRCTMIFTTNTTSTQIRIELSTSLSAINDTYLGDGTSGIYIYGAQLEAGYLTSYIPTYGSAVTRAAETCNNAGNSDLFNDSEGVLYAEMLIEEEIEDNVNISISKGIHQQDLVKFIYISASGEFRFQIYGATGVSTEVNTTALSLGVYNKIAGYYDGTNIKLYINGSEIGTASINELLTGLNQFNFDRADGTAPFYGKTKMVSTFKEALSDSELECLTSWSSFERMATAQNYTIQ